MHVCNLCGMYVCTVSDGVNKLVRPCTHAYMSTAMIMHTSVLEETTL